MIENRNDIACPVALFFRYREICEPNQEFVFCRQSSIAVKLERMRKNQPYLIDPTQRLGERSVSLYCRILSHHIGVKDWEKVKNHRIRSYMITVLKSTDIELSHDAIKKHARHATAKSAEAYHRMTSEETLKLQQALVGKHVPLPEFDMSLCVPKEYDNLEVRTLKKKLDGKEKEIRRLTALLSGVEYVDVDVKVKMEKDDSDMVKMEKYDSDVKMESGEVIELLDTSTDTGVVELITDGDETSGDDPISEYQTLKAFYRAATKAAKKGATKKEVKKSARKKRSSTKTKATISSSAKRVTRKNKAGATRASPRARKPNPKFV